MIEGIERLLPNERLRWLMLAVQREMGSHGLPLILRQAGLDLFVGRLPAADRRLGVLAEDYARLIQAVRAYYGLGARGTLIRIGRQILREQIAAHRIEAFVERLALRFLEPSARSLRTLRQVAARMAYPSDAVRAERVGTESWLVDSTSDRTWGYTTDAPCCWTAVGEISEALTWATGADAIVEEIECRAAGADRCRFVVR